MARAPSRKRFQIWAAVTAAVLAASTGCTPAPQPTGPPSPATLNVTTALDGFANEMRDAGAPAVLVQAKIRGEEWSRVYGVRSLESEEPARISDRTWVGRVTKGFVAVSVLKLVAEGRLGLEDHVSQILPEVDSLLRPPEQVTVRQLLQHRSGMPDYVIPMLQQGSLREVFDTPLSHTERLALAGTQKWERKIAQGFECSNSNYVALGMIVERLRARPIGDVLRTDIVEPLQLKGTAMTQSGLAPGDMVRGYITVFGERRDVSSIEMFVGSPDGGLISTVGDMNTFYSALLRGQLLPLAQVADMQSPLYALYGLGIGRWNDTCTNNYYYGHGGDVPGYGTFSVSSADGSRQVSMSLTHPPGPFGVKDNGIVDEMAETVVAALNAAC
ncbi:serine hydrolase [Arthrobacter sp. AL12]|uniref:serine hydrolase domain-containing protein n=1 Tax=Arthrobacter sp. AL12 TaxID=3042241 RepID=UPI00249CE172|nr:serine hydrolase [Arthrobacter sp. AL12]MDI3212309.1 serine hydrolase [Arthrobacter sp. AL12]